MKTKTLLLIGSGALLRLICRAIFMEESTENYSDTSLFSLFHERR